MRAMVQSVMVPLEIHNDLVTIYTFQLSHFILYSGLLFCAISFLTICHKNKEYFTF